MTPPYNMVGRLPGVRWGCPIPEEWAYPAGHFPHQYRCGCNACFIVPVMRFSPLSEPVGTVISTGELFPQLVMSWQSGSAWWVEIPKLRFIHIYELTLLRDTFGVTVEYRPRDADFNWPDQARYDIWEDSGKGRGFPTLAEIESAFRDQLPEPIHSTYSVWKKGK